LLPIPPQSVAVNETLRVPLSVVNPTGDSTELRFEGPDLPGLERVAAIVTGSGGGEFRWTPLSSHVGDHDFTFIASAGGFEDYEYTIITVTAAADAAPVFLRPGAGGTYDLTRDPCVEFPIEVRDDDSLDVQIRSRSPLPEGAELLPGDPKRAMLHWCPTPDQVEASERWTIELEADDGDHAPTEKDYVVVLRGGAKPDCPGDSPLITIVDPADGARLVSVAGFPVSVTVTDDMGLRDAPLLYYTTTRPEDPMMLDVTTFEQVAFAPTGGTSFSARIPSLGLADGEERNVYYFVSATDNDDPMGTTCDHRVDSFPRTLVAIGSASSGSALACDPCGSARDCASGICATAAGGARCLDTCAASCGAGTCGGVTTVEGGSATACGGVREVCMGGGGACTNDARESDDTIATASTYTTPVTDGMICPDDVDHFRIDAMAGQRVDVTLDGFSSIEGDLDLVLLSSSGSIVGVSGGETDSEMVSYCTPASGPLYARVLGYLGDANHYRLTVATGTGACCVDDTREPDDTRATAHPVVPGTIDGTICPRDDDYAAFALSGPSHVVVTIVFDATTDLDLELYDPSGTVIAASRGVTDTETIDTMVTAPGNYAIRVFGYGGSAGDYLGELRITGSTSGCTTSMGCATGTICSAGSCVDDACTRTSDCPATYLCAAAGPGSPVSDCGAPCTTNAGCRSSEACKWFPEGRACGIRGSHQNGEGCATFRDCGGQRACMPWPSGYCARAGCSSNSDCESGTFCVPVNGVHVCAKDCLASSSVCRLSEGYACDYRVDFGSGERFVCVPSGSGP